jgi:phosphomannomutase/phosphoglucomutase
LLKPVTSIVVGCVLLLAMTVMLFLGSAREQRYQRALEQGERAAAQVQEAVDAFQGLLQDPRVLDLAATAIDDPGLSQELERYLKGRMSELREVRLYGPEAMTSAIDLAGESAFVVMGMLLDARDRGAAPVQALEIGGERVIGGAVPVRPSDEDKGYLLVLADSATIADAFNTTMPQAGYIGLQQANGRFGANTLREFGDAAIAGSTPNRLNVPGSLFRIVLPRGAAASGFAPWQRLLVFVLGGLFLAFGLIRRQTASRPVAELQEDPAAASELVYPESPIAPEAEESAAPDEGEGVRLEDLHFDPERRRWAVRPKPKQAVTMKEEIFRAYDIRGIVGETLDAGVARKVGQAIGSAALEADAAPVVVGRDGRHSGPDLTKGMIEGIAAAGCDVVDIGAVPTGVLYYMANEYESGSGVMITGSHNPPDYNGFKIMIGGETLAGDKIKALYRRIEAGELSEGEGEVQREQNAVERYRERVASDIQLARPLKVVADCGNGIGGVCAADVLRAIGAEVLPLYDEVDGSFPNHHPDPSEPENLKDLIESVDLMGADLGVAFDGDADRLGVVTPTGEIVFPDRVMMLFVREILGRNPGETIIFDVKCTGHLDRVIREAGGTPEMYKTGHSLIKNRMKEVDAPFAGEMSGHFFFKDRWYGFDCGIYSAARLLEILAMDQRPPVEVLGSLPDSVSTPELKVHMAEDENHAFIEKFQQKANFPDARVSTIDGVRADFEDGWGLCRASNTTPILVVRFDAESEEALAVIQEAFRMQMLAIEPNLELPF